MAVLLALASALAYGLSDFVGGLVSRRTSAWAVAVVGQSSSAVCTLGLAWALSAPGSTGDLAWGLLAGVGSGLGTGFLYRGFAAGRMAVVSPVSAVGAALVPLAAGTLGGERPGGWVWLGVAAALPGIWLVSLAPPTERARGRGSSLTAGAVDGVLAGLGFGLLFAALGQVPDSAGWWPLAVCQVVSVPTVVVLALAVGATWRPGRSARPALVLGPLGASATALFLLASQQGYLTVAGVIASLYPAGTVVLAALLLHERVHRVQGVGLALCAVAVTLVAAG